jgi:hypothetical protein
MAAIPMETEFDWDARRAGFVNETYNAGKQLVS